MNHLLNGNGAPQVLPFRPLAESLGQLLTAKQAARKLHVDVRTLYRWVHEYDIPVVRIGRRTLRFPPAALDGWIHDREQDARKEKPV